MNRLIDAMNTEKYVRRLGRKIENQHFSVRAIGERKTAFLLQHERVAGAQTRARSEEHTSELQSH